jgi:DNA-directed RNA polymerase specialized sigma24 family protein
MPCDRPRSEARYELVVARASRGDQAAIEELLDVLRPRLDVYCRRALKDPDQAPQVLHATLDDVVSALPGMKERRAPFPSWAYGLAAQRVRAANGDDDGDVAQDLVARLTDLERSVLVESAQGRALEHIAESLNINVGRVHVARLRALSKLRLPRDMRGLRSIRIVAELLREGDSAGSEVAGSEEDRSEEGALDLRAARAALLADLRATLHDHDVVSSLDRAEAEARAGTPAASSEPRDVGGARVAEPFW